MMVPNNEVATIVATITAIEFIGRIKDKLAFEYGTKVADLCMIIVFTCWLNSIIEERGKEDLNKSIALLQEFLRETDIIAHFKFGFVDKNGNKVAVIVD